MSVNYCQLSSPGDKEEQLRREEVGRDLFSKNKMEEFTFVNYSPSSRSLKHYTRLGTSKYFYDMTNIQFEPKTSANFDITEDRYFKAKETGMYTFYSEHAKMLISGKWISHFDDIMASMVLIKKGEMIQFKIAQSANARGSTLTIFKMK